ncbi:MAG TPA: hypothetical protein VGL66_16805 [Caulobacteraceae bacterium]|jgi:hypothetical protein
MKRFLCAAALACTSLLSGLLSGAPAATARTPAPPPAHKWADIDPKDKQSMMYLVGSPYVDKLSGAVHVELCTFDIECHRRPPKMNLLDTVYTTDAVIDCRAKSVTWSDVSEVTYVSRIVDQKRADKYFAAHFDHTGGFSRGDLWNEVGPNSDQALILARLCATKASLPRRLGPDSPGYGFSIRLVDADDAGGPPPTAGDVRMPMQSAPAGKHARAQRRQSLWLRPDAIIDRSMLASAGAIISDDGPTIVQVQLTEAGARRFADATTANVGKRLAIVVNGEVLSDPVVRDPITGGYVAITGAFTPASAQALARSIMAAAPPAPGT